MFKAEEPEPGEAMVTGENAAVTPVGAPDTDKLTADFRFELAVDVIVTVPE